MVDETAAAGPSTGQAGRGSVAGDLGIRLIYVAVGFTPIVTLALSLVELVPLHLAAPLSISAAAIVGTLVAVTNPRYRPPVLRGLSAGTIAVLLYDCTRLPFVVFGGWPDFIPGIGVWLLNNRDAHWSVGYLWRYLGNGAGMGLAFTVAVPLTRRWVTARTAGIVFGLAVWSGLLITLAAAPNGEDKMFVLTPTTLTVSLIGHIVYGTVLGIIANRGPVG